MPSELLGVLRTSTGRRGVSAYATAAVRHRSAMDGLAEIVAFCEAGHEPLSETEVQATQRDLFGNHGAVRIRFGTTDTARLRWSLFRLRVQDVPQADSLTAVRLLSDVGGLHGHKDAIDVLVGSAPQLPYGN